MTTLLKTFKDLKIVMDAEDEISLDNTIVEWIKYLKSQEYITPEDQDRFYYDNQLDDFIDNDGTYYNVIQFIKYFFDLRRKQI